MAERKPNPFDFVPFPPKEEKPDIRTLTEWLSVDQTHVTGEMTLQIEALTPVHIIGKQESNDLGPQTDEKTILISRSTFWRAGGKTVIPASSIRGMLRSFIEAATNGWVSEITPYYKKETGKRQVGFMNIDAKKEVAAAGDSVDENICELLPERFRNQADKDGKIDLASFLFGYVKDKSACKGRLFFEDAPIFEKLETSENWQVPEIAGKAMMGGPNPSARTWWYQVPNGLRKRNTKNGEVIDFLGAQLRGRKFYFHQDPKTCVDWYCKHWNPPKGKEIEPYDIECLPPKAKTEEFKLSFRELPLLILHLLIWALRPGKNFCHKLGYGKPFGYGSICIHITGLEVEPALVLPGKVKPSSGILTNAGGFSWTAADFAKYDFAGFLHMPSVEALARILYYNESLEQIFAWPTFDRNGFLPIVNQNDVANALKAEGIQKSVPANFNEIKKLTQDEARRLAEKIAEKGKKPALHFEVYQQGAPAYADIQKRTLAMALGG